MTLRNYFCLYVCSFLLKLTRKKSELRRMEEADKTKSTIK